MYMCMYVYIGSVSLENSNAWPKGQVWYEDVCLYVYAHMSDCLHVVMFNPNNWRHGSSILKLTGGDFGSPHRTGHVIPSSYSHYSTHTSFYGRPHIDNGEKNLRAPRKVSCPPESGFIHTVHIHWEEAGPTWIRGGLSHSRSPQSVGEDECVSGRPQCWVVRAGTWVSQVLGGCAV